MTTTIKVSEHTRDRLKRQAAEHQRNLGEHLAYLAALGDRADRMERLRRAIVETTPDDSAAHRAETESWERSELSDASDD